MGFLSFNSSSSNFKVASTVYYYIIELYLVIVVDILGNLLIFYAFTLDECLISNCDQN